MMKTLIKNGRVVTAVDDYRADIFIDGETVSTIGKTPDIGSLLSKPFMTRTGLFQTVILVISIFFSSITTFGQTPLKSSDLLETLGDGLNSIKAERILQHINVLASDKFEGRNPGTLGETLTVSYLISQFRKAGLKPGNPDGTYVQKVPLIGFQTKPQIEFSIKGEKFSLNFPDDFIHEFPRLQPNVTVKNSEVVFAGYGIVAPEYGWDDYKATDVRDKLVIILNGEPSMPDKNDSTKMDSSFFKGELRTFY